MQAVAERLTELIAIGLVEALVRHALTLRVGPVGFRIGSAWRRADRAAPPSLRRLSAARGRHRRLYTVRLEPAKPWRRILRPSVAINGDYWLPDAAPLPLAQGLLAAEMGMNLQLALWATAATCCSMLRASNATAVR